MTHYPWSLAWGGLQAGIEGSMAQLGDDEVGMFLAIFILLWCFFSPCMHGTSCSWIDGLPYRSYLFHFRIGKSWPVIDRLVGWECGVLRTLEHTRWSQSITYKDLALDWSAANILAKNLILGQFYSKNGPRKSARKFGAFLAFFVPLKSSSFPQTGPKNAVFLLKQAQNVVSRLV